MNDTSLFGSHDHSLASDRFSAVALAPEKSSRDSEDLCALTQGEIKDHVVQIQRGWSQPERMNRRRIAQEALTRLARLLFPE